MNKKQLQFAADTVHGIAEHLDMPETVGSMFALLSSQETKEVHAITTDNSKEDLIDMFASALQADKTLLEITVAAVVTAQAGMPYEGDGDLDANPTDSTDPREAEYWTDDKRTPRAKAFAKLSTDQQLVFWKVEDAIDECHTEGAFLITEIMSDPELKGISKDSVREILLAAGCVLVKKRPELYDAADSIFNLDV